MAVGLSAVSWVRGDIIDGKTLLALTPDSGKMHYREDLNYM